MKKGLVPMIITLFIIFPSFPYAASAAEINNKEDAIGLVKSKFTPEEIEQYKKKVQVGLTSELKDEIKREVLSRLSTDEYQALLNVQKQEEAKSQEATKSQNINNPLPISVYINGVVQDFDQSPVIIQGITVVPFRGILEALGAEVTWDPIARQVTATKEDTQIILTIDSDTAEVNGESKTLEVPAQIMNSRTMVPLRFISEGLGTTVDWDAASRSVSIKF